jgi:alpha-tubulin suppressor-like RCC1 family protein
LSRSDRFLRFSFKDSLINRSMECLMYNFRIHAAALPLLAMILIVFSPRSFSAPSEPNAVLEASAEGLAYLDVQILPKGGDEPLRLQFKGTNGLIVGSITLPADAGADYEITAFDEAGRAKYSGKGSIPALMVGDRPLQLPLPSTDTESGKGDGLIVSLSRERLVLEATALEEPNNFNVHLEAFDPLGNPVKLDPSEVHWGLTDTTHFELLPLKERFDVVVRPREGGTVLTPVGDFCDVPPTVVLCIPDLNCRSIRVCPDPWVTISAGHDHTCALKLSGAAYCWGANNLGELGAQSREHCIPATGDLCSTRPLRVECPIGAPCRFTQISAGHGFTVAIDTNGETWSWGDGSRTHRKVSATNAGKPVWFEQISAGMDHGCGLAGSEIWCWGSNSFGQTGAPLVMRKVPFDSAFRVPVPIKFTKVVAGGEHTCALSTAGADVACWGRDDENQTSGPNSSRYPSGTGPFFFQHFGGITPILDVAVSPNSSCVTLGNGNGVNCWGAHSALTLAPFGTPELLSAGHGHVCALANQQASCIGSNNFGEVNAPPPQLSMISAGTAHTCSLTTSGDAYCWGRTLEGQVGTGASNWNVGVPTLVNAP